MTKKLRRSVAAALSVLIFLGPLNAAASAAVSDSFTPAALSAPSDTSSNDIGSTAAVTTGTESTETVPTGTMSTPTGPNTASSTGSPTTYPPTTDPLNTPGDPSLSTSYSLQPTPFALEISPTRLVIGQNDIGKQQRVLVVNRGQSAVDVTVQKKNFVGAADGSLSYQQNAPYAASQWVTVTPMSFRLTPGSTQSVVATITPPAKPEPGDHQVAVVFLVPAGRTAANIKINRGIATPVYITVPGPINDSATVDDLSAPKFALSGPITITARVQDTGTVHRDFRGNTPLVVDAAGGTAAFPDFTVLRGSTRDVSTTWNPPFMCVCNPTVRIVNADGTVHSESVQVIVFPLHIFGMVLAALLVIFFVVVVLRRRYRAGVLAAAASMNSGGGSGDG